MKAKLLQGSILVFLIVSAVITNLPIVTMVFNSFKSNTEIMSSTNMIPKNWILDNYVIVNEKSAFWKQFQNTTLTTISTLLLVILVGALAGYAISRFRTKLSSSFSILLLLLQMFPFMIIILPLFMSFKALNLVDTLLGIIIIHVSISLPFAVLMFKGFFDTIPNEIEEAAAIDGCNKWRTFFRVIMPISGPGIAAVAIFTFLMTWNDFVIANIFLKKVDLMTVPVGLQMFMQQNGTDWGPLSAAAVLSTLPVLVFLFFVQKYIAYGAASGSIKG